MEITENRFKTLNTPCFIFDVSELHRSIQGFYNALNANFIDPIIGYSIKTNSIPYSIVKARHFGAYAEVVSYDEYELALSCGFNPSEIIYNGPMKSKETFLSAVESGAIVNIETKREIEWLKELSKTKIHKIGLRLNINVSHISPDEAEGDDDDSRFGFSVDTNEFEDAVKDIITMRNVLLAGIHIHRTVHSRSVQFYEDSVKYACDVIKGLGLKIDYIDVGGGFFGYFPNKPTFEDYSDAIFRALKSKGFESLKIIVEPGNALVASCFKFLSEVIDVKQISSNKWFITTDGSRNDVDPFFKKTSYFYEIISKGINKTVREQVITGCTCLEYDRLFAIFNEPLLMVGDRILYNNVGAYTCCLSPLFIRYFPRVYAYEDDLYKLVRENWTAYDYLNKSIIE